MNLEQLGKFLIVFAVVLAFGGIVLYLAGRGLGIGRLPGDIYINRGGCRIFIPIVASILLSLILTVILNIVFWFMRR